MMWRIPVLLVVVLIGPGGGLFVPVKPGRPEKCKYVHTHGMLGVDCVLLNLVSVPQDLNTDVQVLSLAVNRIRELHNTSFINYPYLKLLYLEDNSIASIDAGAFAPLTDLEVLDLTLNSLHAVPDALHSLPVLRKLSMGRNHFANVIFMDPLPSVEYLDLSESKLRELPSLEALPRLLTLNVSYNRIKSVNVHQLAPLCRLRDLDLRGNKDLFMRDEGFCDCTLLVQWSHIRHIRTMPSSETICRKASEALVEPVENATCFNNQTDLIFQESSLVARSCEAGVLEYGSGPIRIRSSVLWTIAVITVCAVLLVCFASVYFVRRRQRQFHHDERENITIGKSRS